MRFLTQKQSDGSREGISLSAFSPSLRTNRQQFPAGDNKINQYRPHCDPLQSNNRSSLRVTIQQYLFQGYSRKSECNKIGSPIFRSEMFGISAPGYFVNMSIYFILKHNTVIIFICVFVLCVFSYWRSHPRNKHFLCFH